MVSSCAHICPFHNLLEAICQSPSYVVILLIIHKRWKRQCGIVDRTSLRAKKNLSIGPTSDLYYLSDPEQVVKSLTVLGNSLKLQVV